MIKLEGTVLNVFTQQGGKDKKTGGSWRHTPFRNQQAAIEVADVGSWRHTPFRNK